MFTSVINFGMCTELTTECVSTSGGGLFFFLNGLVRANVFIIYKALCEEINMKTMIHYEFWHLVLLAKIDPKNFGGRNNLFWRFNVKASGINMYLHRPLLFHNNR